jgi:hypothetical protein
MHGRLFFGFEYSFERTVYVVALDPTGRPLLRVHFPLTDRNDTDLDDGAAAPIAAALGAFVAAHDALPVCGTDEDPPVLEALAAAHQRALLAGLAAAEGLGEVGLAEDL